MLGVRPVVEGSQSSVGDPVQAIITPPIWVAKTWQSRSGNVLSDSCVETIVDIDLPYQLNCISICHASALVFIAFRLFSLRNTSCCRHSSLICMVKEVRLCSIRRLSRSSRFCWSSQIFAGEIVYFLCLSAQCCFIHFSSLLGGVYTKGAAFLVGLALFTKISRLS